MPRSHKVGQAFLPVHFSQPTRKRGGALLAVLWLSAALSAIAFSLANTVRGEVERASTAVDGLRSHYLAEAGIDRGILYMEWGMDGSLPANLPFPFKPGNSVLPFAFPSGEAIVQVIPETARLNINTAPPEDLARLLVALRVDPNRAAQVVAAIVDWRKASEPTEFDSFYMSLTPSFRARHASFEEIEELLLVRGMTRELFYGGYDHDAEGRLVPRGGLKDCVSVFGTVDGIDVNNAQPAVLVAMGMAPEAAAAIADHTRTLPFKGMQDVAAFAPGGGQAVGRLGVGGKTIFTLRSTGRIRLPNGQLSDLRRTAAATVKFTKTDALTKVEVLRWYDNAWTP
jgi:general secretion pathway protein K